MIAASMQEQIRAVRGDRSRQFLIDTDIIYLPVTSSNMRRVIAAFGRPEIPQPVSDRLVLATRDRQPFGP